MTSPAVPYQDCLLWKLAAYYYFNRGAATWRLSETPYVLTSNLQYAYQLAWVVHAALESQADLPLDLHFLETGAGHGVFSMNFLKAFRDVCLLEKTDYFSRLTYLISDISPRYLQEIAAQPLLQPLIAAGQVQILQLDLTNIPQACDLQGKPISLHDQNFQAVFCNYVFDTLPLAVYQLSEGHWREKWVRTEVHEHLPRSLPPHHYALKDTLFISEFRDLSLGKVAHPWIQSFLSTVQHSGQTGLYPVSEVSLKALEGLFSLLAPAGVLWLADKGFLDEMGLRELDFWPQTYGLCVTHSVNFPLLRDYLQTFGAACLLDSNPKHQLKFLLAQKTQTLSDRLRNSWVYHFLQHNRNETQFIHYVQDCDRLLRGQGPLFTPGVDSL